MGFFDLFKKNRRRMVEANPQNEARLNGIPDSDINAVINDNFKQRKKPVIENKADEEYRLQRDIYVSIDDSFKIKIPKFYSYSTDSEVIGEFRAMVALPLDEEEKLGNPYAASESITVLFGEKIESNNEVDGIAASMGLTSSVVLRDDSLNIRYMMKENSEELTIYLALICTRARSYPMQFFFHEARCKDPAYVVRQCLLSAVNIM